MKVKLLYAVEDSGLKDKLHSHLKTLEKLGYIKLLEKPLAGSNVNEVMKQHLQEADILLPLISSDFIKSDLYDITEKQYENGKTIVPIILRSCQWEESFLKNLSVLPVGGQPVKNWHDNDVVFNTIITAIKQLTPKKSKEKEAHFKEDYDRVLNLIKRNKFLIKVSTWIISTILLFVGFVAVLLLPNIIPFIENIQFHYLITLILSPIAIFYWSSRISDESIEYKKKSWLSILGYALIGFILVGLAYQYQLSDLKTCTVIDDDVMGRRMYIIPEDKHYTQEALDYMEAKGIKKEEDRACKLLFHAFAFDKFRIWEEEAIKKVENRIRPYLYLLFFGFSIIIFSVIKLVFIQSKLFEESPSE